MDHVAGRFFFVADDGFSGSKADSSDRPLALPIRAAVARDRPTFAAIFQKGMRLRRIASTASSCSLPVFFLNRLGPAGSILQPGGSFGLVPPHPFADRGGRNA